MAIVEGADTGTRSEGRELADTGRIAGEAEQLVNDRTPYEQLRAGARLLAVLKGGSGEIVG